MKIKMTPVTETFDLSIGGEVLGRFTEESQWEGFSKLTGVNGEVLFIERSQGFVDQVFFSVFNDKKEPVGVSVIKGTPDLVIKIQELLAGKCDV